MLNGGPGVQADGIWGGGKFQHDVGFQGWRGLVEGWLRGGGGEPEKG